MFHELRVENYKAWRGSHRLRLAPITLLLGTNSAGKTSLIQPLLLLKQTVEGADRRIALNLGGQDSDIVHVGGFRDDVLAKGARPLRVSFGLDFDYRSRKGRQRGERINFDVTFEAERARGLRIRSLAYATKSERFGVEARPDGSYEVAVTGRETADAKRSRSKSFSPEGAVNFSSAARVAFGAEGGRAADLSLALTDALQRLQYLGPLRDAPRRAYVWNGQTPTTIGPRGERVAQTLISHLKDGGVALTVTLDKWMQRLQLAHGIHVASDEHGLQPGAYEIHIERGGGAHKHINLVDVGFGISQALPVVALALTAEPGTTLILEQPELHLHPLAQAGLADLFVEVINRRRLQVIAETHSEHMFRRLQTLIASEEIKAADCALYYVDRRNDRSTIRSLEPDEFGRIDHWPDGFFGDSTGEMERQAVNRIRRTRAREKAARGA